MAVTSIDIDQDELRQAKELAGTTSNRETVDLALRTLIAVRRQPAAVSLLLSSESLPALSNPTKSMLRRSRRRRRLLASDDVPRRQQHLAEGLKE